MLKEELRQTLSGIIFSNEDYKNKLIDKLLGGGGGSLISQDLLEKKVWARLLETTLCSRKEIFLKYVIYSFHTESI